MPQKLKTLIRLDSSAYHEDSFFNKEEKMATLHGLRYFPNLEEYKNAVELSDESICLISNTHTQPTSIDSSILEKTLLWIHSNSGYDNFSTTFVEAQKFPIILGNPIRAAAVTEYILAQLLACYGLSENQNKWDFSRKWSRPLLRNQKIVICGYGLIGSALEKSLSSLCPNISVFDPFKFHDQKISFKEFLQEQKGPTVLLLACSLNSTSKDIVNEETLKSLSPNCLIINAARGGLIDQRALVSFLKTNSSSQAILDVFAKEPPDEDVYQIDNLKKSSHIAGVSENLDDNIITFEEEVIKKFHLLNDHDFLNSYENLNLKSRISLVHQELI